MKLDFPANYDAIHWLVKLEYRTGASVQLFRWVLDGDQAVAVTGDGTYMPHGPVVDVAGFDRGGERLEDRRWNIVLADPQRTHYKTTFADNWRNRRCDLSMYTTPDNTVTPRKTGYLLQRTPVGNEQDGFTLVLAFGGLLDRVVNTKKLYTNPKAQRARAMEIMPGVVDDCADHAQDTVDANWGGNL